jgi:hypothetical protein
VPDRTVHANVIPHTLSDFTYPILALGVDKGPVAVFERWRVAGGTNSPRLAYDALPVERVVVHWALEQGGRRCCGRRRVRGACPG